MFFLYPLHKRKRKMPWRHHLFPSSACLNKILVSLLFLEAVYGVEQIFQSPQTFVHTINTTEYIDAEEYLSTEEPAKEDEYAATIYGVQVHLKKWEIKIFRTRRDKAAVSP